MWRASVKDCLKRDEVWWFFLHFSFASYNAWFNAALILPSENLEVTLQWKKKKKEVLSLHFQVFFFGEWRQARSKRGAHACREKTQKNSRVSCSPRSLCSCLLAFQKETTLVMLAKKSLGKLKATLLKKNLRKSCLLLRYKVHVVPSQKLLIFSYIIEMLSSDW